MDYIQKSWGVGKIYNIGCNAITLEVKSIKELQVVRQHFENYPLITQKLADFILWKKVVAIKEKKQHLTQQGLEQIVNLKASINLGLSDQLPAAFPDIQPVQRPLVLNQVIKDPQ